MALNIKNERAIELARQVAELTGETLTGAIVESLEQRLQLLTSDADRQARIDRIMALARDNGERIRNAGPGITEADLYDERGLPA